MLSKFVIQYRGLYLLRAGHFVENANHAHHFGSKIVADECAAVIVGSRVIRISVQPVDCYDCSEDITKHEAFAPNLVTGWRA